MRPITEVEALPQPWYILVSSQPIIEETSPLMESLETHGLVPDVEVIYSEVISGVVTKKKEKQEEEQVPKNTRRNTLKTKVRK